MEELIQKIVDGQAPELTLLGMGTVFFCLAALYLFFASTGLVVKTRSGKTDLLKDPSLQDDKEALKDESGELSEEVAAVIAMALEAALERTRPSLTAISAAGSPAVGSWRTAGRISQHARSKFWEQ